MRFLHAANKNRSDSSLTESKRRLTWLSRAREKLDAQRGSAAIYADYSVVGRVAGGQHWRIATLRLDRASIWDIHPR